MNVANENDKYSPELLLMLQLSHFDRSEIGLRGKCRASRHAQLAGKEQQAQIKNREGEKDTGVYENTYLFAFFGLTLKRNPKNRKNATDQRTRGNAVDGGIA